MKSYRWMLHVKRQQKSAMSKYMIRSDSAFRQRLGIYMPEGNPKKLITFGHMCRKNNDRLINEFAFTKNKERHLTKQMDR